MDGGAAAGDAIAIAMDCLWSRSVWFLHLEPKLHRNSTFLAFVALVDLTTSTSNSTKEMTWELPLKNVTVAE